MTSPKSLASPRAGQRANAQLRDIAFSRQAYGYAAGAVLLRWGGTTLLCSASVEEKVPPHRRGSGAGWVTAEYAMLPTATHTRGEREAAKGKLSGRTQEIQRLIGRALRSVTDLAKLGERSVIVDCDVLQADGGTRVAAITGGCVALALALRDLRARGVIQTDPLRCLAAAVSVGVHAGQALLDLDYAEDSTCEVDMNVVMTEHGEFIEVQGTAEGAPFQRAQLDAMLDLATTGIRELHAMQRQVLALA